jgi:hypothetical protein
MDSAQAEHKTTDLCNNCQATITWIRNHEPNDGEAKPKHQLSHEAFQQSALKCLLCAYILHDIFDGKPPEPQSDETWNYSFFVERMKGVSKLMVLREDTIPGVPFPLPSSGFKGTYYLAHLSGKHHQIRSF